MSSKIEKRETRDILAIDPESIRAKISGHHLIPSEFYALGQGEYEGKVFRYFQSAYSSRRQKAERLASFLTKFARKMEGPDQVVVVGVDIDEEKSRRRGTIVFNNKSLGLWRIRPDLSGDPTFISWMKGEGE